MPITGELKVYPEERASSFSHEKEIAKPDYYAVTLDDYNIRAEVTATTRAGLLKFTFPKSRKSYLIIDSNAAYEPTTDKTEGDGYIEVIPEENEVIGYNPAYRMYQGWGEPAGIKGYFVFKFSKPFNSYGTWNHGKQPEEGSKRAEDRPGAFIKLETDENEVIKVRVGTSFTSIEDARENLESEIPGWDFDEIREATKKAWNKELSRIEIKGGSEEQRINFYTALYHCLLVPRVFSDVDGSYVGFDGDTLIHIAEDFTYYCDFSLWDTYRALHPLFTIIQPERTVDMIKSILVKSEQGGWLPIFPAWNSYTSEMIGDHAISMIVDAYMKGIQDFDVDRAYELMKKNATQLPEDYDEYVQGKGRRALDIYIELGYIPIEEPVKEAFHDGEQVSRTLEYAYDDFCLAEMAKALGKDKDYETFIQRAYNYKNIFDPSVGFVRGRHKDGSWTEPFDPIEKYKYITEGTPWQYTWYVPHDVQGLIELMGGREEFLKKLDTLFERASRDSRMFRNTSYYLHGNEPSHQISYLFTHAGTPWKTQKWVREIMERAYNATPGGLSGNDDAGQMSAWYIFSAMGFYPVCPGSPTYEIGSPLFDEVIIHAEKDFVIKAINNSRKNKYIQKAWISGKPLNKPWFEHNHLVKGDTLIFEMGPLPNREWGSEPDIAPPSISK